MSDAIADAIAYLAIALGLSATVLGIVLFVLAVT